MDSVRDSPTLKAIGVIALGALVVGFIVWDLVSGGTMISAVMVLGLGAIFLATYRPKLVMHMLLASLIILLRPNIWAGNLGLLAVALLVVVGFLVLASARFKTDLHGPEFKGMLFVPVWLTLSYVMVTMQASARGIDAAPIAVGALGDVGAVVATLMILSRRSYWKAAVKAFVGLTVVVSLSYVATLGYWAVAGIGGGDIGTIPGAYGGNDTRLLFPFTPVISSLQVFGVTVPRFTGFGREPGWMALYSGTAFLLFPYTGWKGKLLRSSLLVSLLGTLSTGGFGVFAVTIALSIFLGKGGQSTLLSRLGGFVLLAGGAYAALFAPVLGFAAKETQNVLSLDERSRATAAGLHALLTHPFAGGLATGNIPNVNLIAAVAAYGVIYVLAIALAVLCVMVGHPQRAQLLPPVIGVFGTLLTAQPANGSTFIYCLVLICAVATFDPLVKGPAGQTRIHPRGRGRTPNLAGAYRHFGRHIPVAEAGRAK